MKHKITAVDMNPALPYRCHYIARSEDDGKLKPMRWSVVGMAATDTGIYPLRVEDRTGRGVLIGHDSDPLVDGFLGVLVAGEPVSALGDEVDERARALIRADLEADDAEEDED